MPNKIGVFLCDCGGLLDSPLAMADLVDSVVNLKNVTAVGRYEYLCSKEGLEILQKFVKDHELTGIVIGACAPHLHDLTFKAACEQIGLDRNQVKTVDIRESCAWAGLSEKEANEKAFEQIKAALETDFTESASEKPQINFKTLVVGSNRTAVNICTDLFQMGREIYMVEEDPFLAKETAQPDCYNSVIAERLERLKKPRKAHLMPFTEIESIEGSEGNFKVTLREKTRFVNEDCTECGACEKRCPVTVPNQYLNNQSQRTAIFHPYPGAYPHMRVIEKAEERPPCQDACPIGQHAGGYVSLIAEKKFASAYALIRRDNPFAISCGRACFHPCETACNRGHVDEPIAIRQLKRFVTDWAMKNPKKVKPLPVPEEKIGKVAIVGAGPAGLACAHYLTLKGYQCTVYEQEEKAGGMLRYGIPEYRLPNDLLDHEIKQFEDLGIEIICNASIGKFKTLQQLKEDEGFGAVFMAAGAQTSLSLRAPGEDLKGVYGGLEYRADFHRGKNPDLGAKVIVVGGGNTAIDAARVALRQGADRVIILYRRTRKEMPADEAEIVDALEEGIELQYLSAPVELIGDENGQLKKMRCIKMELGEPDSSGRRRPVPIKGSEYNIEVDTIIPAISQGTDLNFLEGNPTELEIKLSRWDTPDVNPETMQTNIPWVFSGGDCVTGPSSIVEAMSDGRRACEAIDKFLRGEKLEGFTSHRVDKRKKRVKGVRPNPYAPTYDETPKKERVKPQHLSVEDRKTNFDEIEQPLSEAEAIAEAQRCLHCGVCVDCLECERICPSNAVDHSMTDKVSQIEVGQILVCETRNSALQNLITQNQPGIRKLNMESLGKKR